MKGLMCKMAENNEWATPTLKEAPYWKDGMSVEEYEKEREYYYKHLKDVRSGTYIPLWKQEAS